MFKDRQEAGDLLALKLKKLTKEDFVIVPLLRGGIVLGKRISDYLNIPQKPLAVKKIGAPFDPELGIGAVTADKTYYFNDEMTKSLGISEDYRKAALEDKYKEAKLLQKMVEESRENIQLGGKNIIIVDDGVAIGNTVICASLCLKKQNVEKIILATPLIFGDGMNNIKKYFDKVVYLKIATDHSSIGSYYKYFPQVEMQEVMRLL